ncbi:hypothetical protein AGMMS49546_15750 [Spirochaetia bacterium]|nr:hypothetical protein AGMMS49546_15750 [Spirochaetia bacterium]
MIITSYCYDNRGKKVPCEIDVRRPRYDKKGRLFSCFIEVDALLIKGFVKVKLTNEVIQVEGFEEWCAVTAMDEPRKRVSCLVWVRGLITQGIIKRVIE